MLQEKINEFFQLIEFKSFTLNEIIHTPYPDDDFTISHGKFKTPASLREIISPLSKSISVALSDLDIKNLNFLKNLVNEYLNDWTQITKENQDFSIQKDIEINFSIERHFTDVLQAKELSTSVLKIVQEFWKSKEESLQTLLSSVEEQLEIKSSSPNILEKLEFKLSVADIALLFRLLDDENLINYKHKTAIYRHIAETIKTEKQENVSEASIKNKFLSPDNTSIKKLDILLVNLRQNLKKL